jgi:hypothetical protein
MPVQLRFDYSRQMDLACAAIGFRMHTGWAALVVAAGRPGKVAVLLRRRFELLPADGSIPRFAYHEAAELPAADASRLVRHAAAGARRAACFSLRAILEQLRGMNVAVKAAGIPTGSTVVPADLSRILGAHPLIHAAEGEMFSKAVAAACRECGLLVVTARERDLWSRAAEIFGLEAAAFRQSLDDLRPSVGPPWSADQKTATAAALLALRTR